MSDALLVIVIIVALGFDFTNGFHDTANAVATSISTRAMSPRVAVLVASVANLAGAFVTTAVAKTVGSGIINVGLTDTKTVFAALIGGLVGAAIAQSGSAGVQWSGLLHKVLIPAVVSPAIAFVAAFALLLGIFWVFVRMTPGLANRTFRLGQLGSGTWVAFTHGANDA